MNKEFKIPKRFNISLQYGYYGKKVNIDLSPLIVYAAGLLLLALLVLSTLYLAVIVPHSSLRSRVELLNTENKELREKLDIYAAALDSIAVHLKLDLKIHNNAGDSGPDSYPYYDADNDYESDIAFGYDVFLSTRISQIEQNLTLLLNTVQSGDSVGYDPTGMNIDLNSHAKPSIYPTFGRISDGWGMRIHPIYKRLAFHNGIDIANNLGTPIYATAPGLVAFTGYDNEYGKLIKIEHNGGYETRYGHLYNFQVREGDTVKRGQIIGLMGNTGNSTGPHLHYEILVGGSRVNPTGYLNRLDDQIYVRY